MHGKVCSLDNSLHRGTQYNYFRAFLLNYYPICSLDRPMLCDFFPVLNWYAIINTFTVLFEFGTPCLALSTIVRQPWYRAVKCLHVNRSTWLKCHFLGFWNGLVQRDWPTTTSNRTPSCSFFEGVINSFDYSSPIAGLLCSGGPAPSPKQLVSTNRI